MAALQDHDAPAVAMPAQLRAMGQERVRGSFFCGFRPV